jgi:hypothetical protein
MLPLPFMPFISLQYVNHTSFYQEFNGGHYDAGGRDTSSVFNEKNSRFQKGMSGPDTPPA